MAQLFIVRLRSTRQGLRHLLHVVRAAAARITLNLQAQIRDILQAAASSAPLIPGISLLFQTLLLVLVLDNRLAQHFLQIHVSELI